MWREAEQKRDTAGVSIGVRNEGRGGHLLRLNLYISKPETRNPRPETRNRNPGTRNPTPETRNPKPGPKVVDGNRYEGNFKDGLFDGKGKKTWVRTLPPASKRNILARFHPDEYA